MAPRAELTPRGLAAGVTVAGPSGTLGFPVIGSQAEWIGLTTPGLPKDRTDDLVLFGAPKFRGVQLMRRAHPP